MLYKIFNVYPYYVINLALYLFAFEFILLIVMKCHIIWWCYVHILVYNFSPRRWFNVYICVFQRGGTKAYFKVFHCVNLIILNLQGVSGPGEGWGGGWGQPWAPSRSAHACTFIWFWVTKELNSIIACNIGWSNLNKTGDD